MSCLLFAKKFIPPFIWDFLKKFKRDDLYCGVYQSFDQVPKEKPWREKSFYALYQSKLDSITSSTKNCIPISPFSGYRVIPCLVVNMMSCKGPVKVLDFAGGTGVIYYGIRPYLSDPSNVTWDVYDFNEEGLEIGRAFDPKDKNIQFYSQLPDRITNCYDVVYINTALHHFSDYRAIIKELLDFQPTYFVLTRLLAGEVPSYVSSVKYPSGARTPFRVINVLELSEFFNENGYKLIFKAPTEELTKGKFSKDVPEDLKIEFTLNLVFRKD